jgi:Protein of unknown function (DUF1242)
MSCDTRDTRELSFQVQRLSNKAILQQLFTPDPATMVRRTILREVANLEYVMLTLAQSALFNFTSALLCLLLLICTSAYIHQLFPGIMDRNKDG